MTPRRRPPPRTPRERLGRRRPRACRRGRRSCRRSIRRRARASCVDRRARRRGRSRSVQPPVATRPPRTSTADRDPLAARSASSSSSIAGRGRRPSRSPPAAAPALERRSTRAAESRRPPPYWTGTSELGGDPLEVVEVHRPSRARAVEVDDVQPARALPRPSARAASSGSAAYSVLRGEVALLEAHGLAAEDVDGRDRAPAALKPAAPTAAQIAGEVLSSLQAVRARLLRVELDAVERLALDRAHEGLAVARRSRARRRPPARPARTSARSRTEHSSGQLRRSARSACVQRTAFQPMCGTFRPGRRQAVDPALQEAQPPGALVLARGLEQQLHARGRCRASARRPRAARRAATSSSSSRRLRIAFGNAPDAGQDQRRRRRGSRRGRGSRPARAPIRSSAFSTERRLPIP